MSTFVKKQDISGDLSLKEDKSNKNIANGYAGLDVTGKVASAQLPSYVDDVIEVANFAALPVTGETGKIYVTIDTSKSYRWSGTVYTEIGQNEVNSVFGRTGVVTAQNGDYTASQVTNVPSGIVSSTTVQGAIDEIGTDLDTVNTQLIAESARIDDILNTELPSKEDNLPIGTVNDYLRGDKTFQVLDKNAVGLGNVDNTSDLAKPISTAMQTALILKEKKFLINVSEYGALGNGKTLTTISINSGSNVFNSSVANFTAGDIGKVIAYAHKYNNGQGGSGTITAVNSATQVVLSTNSGFTLSDDAYATYGTDDTIAIQNAFNYAASIAISNTLTDPNTPFNGGRPTVLLPYMNSGNYMITAQISTGNSVGIEMHGSLHNALASRTTRCFYVGKGCAAQTIDIKCYWGYGTNIGDPSSNGDQTASAVKDIYVYQASDNAVTLYGFNHYIGKAFIKEATRGIYHSSGSDCCVVYAKIIGCLQPVYLRSSNQVSYGNLQLDSCGGTGTNYGITLDNVAGGCADIQIVFTAFVVNTAAASSDLTYIVGCLDNNTQNNAQIRIHGSANNTGGGLLLMQRCQETDFNILGSNYIGSHQITNPILTGVTYGAGNSGTNKVHMDLAGSITPSNFISPATSIYPGLSYYQGGISYRAGGKIAEDNTVGSENARLRSGSQMRFYDTDNSNYVAFKAPANLTANTVYNLPLADGTAGQFFKTDGSGNTSWGTVAQPSYIEEQFLNSSTQVFSLANTPISLIKVDKNGLGQALTEDYTISGATVTFVAGNVNSNDDIIIGYFY